MPIYAVNRLNAGQLDERIDAGDDLAKYATGCRTCKNMIPMVSGGARFRPGTKFVAKAKEQGASNVNVGGRLYDFVVSNENPFILEAGHQYLRFYNSRARIEDLEETITGATQANPVVVTISGTHTYVNGDPIFIEEVAGMTELNGKEYVAANVTASTFELSGVDGTGFTAYTSGGKSRKIIEVSTPYQINSSTPVNDLERVQFERINNVAYATHPSYDVRKLVRSSNTSWTFDAVDWETAFSYPPMLDENLTDTTLTVSFSNPAAWATSTAYVVGDQRRQNSLNWECIVAHTSGTFQDDLDKSRWKRRPVKTTDTGVTLVSSASLFESDHVGSYWQVTHDRQGKSQSINISSSELTSGEITVLNKALVTTSGTWEAVVHVERLNDVTSEWEAVITYDGETRNISQEFDQEGIEAQYRVRVSNWTSSTGARVTIETEIEPVDGLVKVTAFNSATSVDVDVIRNVEDEDATLIWREGAFSDVQGFPTAAAFFEGRLWYGKEQLLFGSEINNFDNFKLGTRATDAVLYQITSATKDAILWMEPKEDLVLGTASNEIRVGRADEAKSISVENDPFIREQSRWGSNPKIPGIQSTETILFNRKQGFRVMELDFQVNSRFSSVDLNRLAESITRETMIDAAYQLNPDSIYWVCTQDGKLLALTYERKEDVVGWSVHETFGESTDPVTDETGFRSVAVIPTDDEDEVWTFVKRQFAFDEDGNPASPPEEIFFIEYITTQNEMSLLSGIAGSRRIDRNSIVRLDSAVQGTSLIIPQSTVDGLEHLNGQTVKVYGDGNVLKDAVVSNGSVSLVNPEDDLSYAAAYWTIGLQFTARIEPMNFAIITEQGTSRASRVNAIKAYIRYQDSFGSVAGAFVSDGRTTTDGNSYAVIKEAAGFVIADGRSELQGGVVTIPIDQKVDYDTGVFIEQTDPLPLTVTGVTLDLEINEPG